MNKTYENIKEEYNYIDQDKVVLRKDLATGKEYYVPHKSIPFMKDFVAPHNTGSWVLEHKCTSPLRITDDCHKCPIVELCCSARAAKGRLRKQDAIKQIKQYNKGEIKEYELVGYAKQIIKAQKNPFRHPGDSILTKYIKKFIEKIALNKYKG